MSGVTSLHCPHCMAEVPKRMVANVPGLILIDRYVCPVCGWMTLREELVEETKLNILRSGAIPVPPPPPEFSFSTNISAFENTSGNDFDNDVTSPAFTPGADDIIVVCVSSRSAETVTEVSFAGIPLTMAASGTEGSNVSGSMWYLLNPPQVQSVVSVTWSGTINFGIAVASTITAKPTFVDAQEDHNNDPFLFDSGGVGLSQIDDCAVAMCAANEDMDASGAVFFNGFDNNVLISSPNGLGIIIGLKLVTAFDAGVVASQGEHGVGNWVAIAGVFR